MLKNKSNPYNVKTGDIVVPSGLQKTTQGFEMKHLIKCKVIIVHSCGECIIKILESSKSKYVGAKIYGYITKAFRPVNLTQEYEIY